MNNVLITEAEVKQALASAQSLGRKGCAISAISANPGAPTFYSKYCREKFKSPYVKHKDEYITRLLEIVRAGYYDALIPFSDGATEYVSEIRDQLLAHTRFRLPAHDDLMCALHKDQFMRFCEAKGFPYPRTFFPKGEDDIAGFQCDLDYPFVLKGSRGASAETVKYVDNKDGLIAAYAKLKGKSPEFIIQERIEGDQLGFYGLCDEGEPFAFIMCEVMRSYPASGGSPAKAVSIHDKNLEELSRSIIRELRWSGMVNIDFIREAETGEYKILEINPRIPGTVSLAIACGVDFPALLYEYVVNDKKTPRMDYPAGKVFRSIFKEDALYACERLRMIPLLLLETLNPFVTYGIDLGDLRPLIGMLKMLKWEVEDTFIHKIKRR